MPERDWEKDWELCQEAVSGPWRVEVCGIDFTNGNARHFVKTPGGLWIDVGYAPKTAGFIAESREGWPAALEERTRLAERVKELEAKNKRLRDALRYVCLGLCDYEYHKRVGLCEDCRVYDALKGGENDG
jgi:hypothetical protein